MFLVTLTYVLLGFLSAGAAEPAEGLRWTHDPALVPWETMTTSGDPERQPARTRDDLRTRRAVVKAKLDRSDLNDPERAAALAELGDLFRDEARLVLEQDADDPWRIPLPTSPAWLQLELAAGWYARAMQADPESVDADGRLTLLQAVIASRLGREEPFDDYVRVIRSYRSTPFVEMAKLAVGDHHFRAGDLDRARTAYRMVRENRDPELASYARYRLASVHAALGEHDDAKALLREILDRPEPGPLLAMLRDAARSALANQLARELSLPDMITWLDQACPAQDQACRRAVRAAAADTSAKIGDDRAAAWLRTVDASEPLADRLDVRLELARTMLAEAPVLEVLLDAEGTCARSDDPCRAELAHAVTRFYDESADPDGGWLPAYLQLPRMKGRPDVQRATARIAQSPAEPQVELATLEGLCPDVDRSCKAQHRVHLRAVWSRLDRLHDAAWLRFVDDPLPVPGSRAQDALAMDLVRQRAPAATLLAELGAPCETDACADELFEILVGYYAAIGEDSEASWLIALKTLPALPVAPALRDALRQAALSGDSGPDALRAMLSTCTPLVPACFRESRLAAQAFFRAAARHGDAAALERLGLFTSRAVPPSTFSVLVHAALDDPPVARVLESIERACPPRDQGCGPQARSVLAEWYGRQDRYADRLAVVRVDEPPDLGAYKQLGPAFMRVVRTATDPRDAAARVVGLCPSTSAACATALIDALAVWYDRRGELDAARTVRAYERGGGFIAPAEPAR